MLSRVAESLYWMSRYLERAENTARFIDAQWNLTLDMPDQVGQDWIPLISATGDQELFFEHYEEASKDNVMEFLTFDTRYPSSILSCVMYARENARSVREMLSPELWQEVNSMYHMLRNRGQDPLRLCSQVNEFYTRVKLYGLTCGGIVNNTMVHGAEWHFVRMGRLLERADKSSRIIDVKYFTLLPSLDYVGTPYDNIQWASLLRSLSALETYRRIHGQIDPNSVVNFLMLHHDFPRSIRHCIRRVDESVRFMTNTASGYFANSAGQKLGQFVADLSYMNVEQIMEQGLHEFVDTVQQRVNVIDRAIHASFFDVVDATESSA